MSLRFFNRAAQQGGSRRPSGVDRASSKDSTRSFRGLEAHPAALTSPPPPKSFYELISEVTSEYDRARHELSEMCAENARLRMHLNEQAQLVDMSSPVALHARWRSNDGTSNGARFLPTSTHTQAPKASLPVGECATVSLRPLLEVAHRPTDIDLPPEPERPESPRPPPCDDSEDAGRDEDTRSEAESPTTPPLEGAGRPKAPGGECLSPTSSERQDVDFDGAAVKENGRTTSTSDGVCDGERGSFGSLSGEGERGSFGTVSSMSMTDKLMVKSDDMTELELLPVWVRRVKKPGRRPSLDGISSLDLLNFAQNRIAPAQDGNNIVFRTMRIFTVKPNARIALLWDIVTISCLLYDMVVIPLGAYELPETGFFKQMEICNTVIWTIDIVFSCFKGYEAKGVVEMHPKSILKNYAKGWFWFDISIVSVDWVLFVVEEGDVVDFLRFTRFRRAIRLLRLARLLKHGQKLLAVTKHVQSEEWLVILRIVWLMIILLAINHFISCAWYAIGMEKFYTETWTKYAFSDDLESHDFAYRYFTSFHWSMTQFSPASMEVRPHNTMERIFNIIMILLGLLMFSSFVSNMTNGMTFLTKRNYEKRQEREALMHYMNAKDLSLELRGDITLYFSAKTNRQRFVVKESDIGALKNLPETLLEQMHIEVHMPVFHTHPLFANLHAEDPGLLHRVCHHAMSDKTLLVGEEMFRFGVRATCMSFMISGSGKYMMGYGEEAPIEVHARQWISEACLWVMWDHRGRLQTTSVCEYSELNSMAFQTLMTRFLCLTELQRYARLYAHHAARENGGAEHVTDLWGQRMRIIDLVQKAFRPDEADADNPASKVLHLWRGDEFTTERLFTEWKSLWKREMQMRQPGLVNWFKRWYHRARTSRLGIFLRWSITGKAH